MAIVNGTDIGFVDLKSNAGGNTFRHMFRDAQARADVDGAAVNTSACDIWAQGGFYADGSTADSQTAIRTNVFQRLKNVIRITCPSDYFIVLYAWDGNTYMGMWDGAAFGTSGYARNTDLQMQPIIAAYPAYTYRLAMRHADTSATITPEDGSNCLFITANTVHVLQNIEGADMTAIIVDALTKYGSVELGEGSFLINNIVMPDFTALRGQGRATKLVLGNYHTHGITSGKGCTIENLEIDGKASAVPDSKGDSAGIAIISNGSTDYYNIKISDVTIYGFNLAGIYVYKTGYWDADSVSAVNCEMRFCYAGIFCDTNAEYGRYTNILVYGCYFGALVNGGNNKFANCDFTSNKVGFYLNAQAEGTVNNGHGSCVGCTFNHSDSNVGRAILANSVTNGYIFSGCQIHYGTIYAENASCLLFDGCSFGLDVGVTDYGNAAIIFEGCTFRAVPTKSGDQKALYIDCYLLSGEAMGVTAEELDERVTVLEGKIDIMSPDVWGGLNHATLTDGFASLMTRQGYISLSYNGQTVDPETVISSTDYLCALINVTPGEKYAITGSGGDGDKKLLGAVNANNTVLAISPANAAWTNVIYTVPANCKYLIINAKTSAAFGVTRQENLDSRVGALEQAEQAGAVYFDLTASKSIVLLGDSITHGYGSSDFSATGDPLNVSVHATRRNVGTKCWGNQFVQLMTNEYNSTAVNNGVSQFTVADLAANLDVLLPANTDYCVLMIGTNNRSYAADTFATQFASLLDSIIGNGTTPFVFSPIPVNGAEATMHMGIMQQIIKSICDEKRVKFYPMYSRFAAYAAKHQIDPATLYADTLHPNDAGYAVMYGLFRELLNV